MVVRAPIITIPSCIERSRFFFFLSLHYHRHIPIIFLSHPRTHAHTCIYVHSLWIDRSISRKLYTLIDYICLDKRYNNIAPSSSSFLLSESFRPFAIVYISYSLARYRLLRSLLANRGDERWRKRRKKKKKKRAAHTMWVSYKEELSRGDEHATVKTLGAIMLLWIVDNNVRTTIKQKK